MKKLLKGIILPGFIFFSVSAATTFPLFLKLGLAIPGFFSTDESFAMIWNAWRIKFVFLNHLSMNSTDLIAYPYGVEFFSNGLISYVWISINYLLAIFTTPVLTYNIQVIMNFFLSAIFTYLLVFRLTKCRFAGIFSGIAFGLCPYLFMRAWQHLGETYVWPMPMFLWSVFCLKEDLRLRVKIIFILGLVLAAINYSVIYYTSVVFICLLLYLLINWKGNLSYIRRILFLSLIAAIVLLPQFWPVIRNIMGFDKSSSASAWNVFQRPFEDLFEQSARPLSYFLPAAVHPLFGKFTEQFIGSKLYGMSFTEHTLYLGWVPLILAFIAFRGWKKQRKDSFNIGFFIFLAVAAWFFSQAPWWQIGALKIYMPSFFMYKVMPMFRAYCRFGIVVMLAVSVLAGFGLKILLDRFKSFNQKFAVACFLCCLVLFEFWNYPPYKIIDVSKAPSVYYWLKSQPKDTVIAEYPFNPDSPNELYRLYQIFYEKKMINYTIPTSEANMIARTMTKLSENNTMSYLKKIGVKYVLVHRDDYLNTDLVEEKKELEKISQNKGLKLVKSYGAEECPVKDFMCIQKTGPIDVYEVIVEPIEFKEKN